MPTILVVEADALARRTFQALLEDAKYSVRATDSFVEAQQICRNFQIALALINVFLQDGQAVDLVRHLRRESPQTKLIMVTGGFTELGFASLVAQMGVSKLLQKPFPPSLLLDTVRELIGPP